MRLSPASGAKVDVSRRDDIVVRVHYESGISVVKQLRAGRQHGLLAFRAGTGRYSQLSVLNLGGSGRLRCETPTGAV